MSPFFTRREWKNLLGTCRAGAERAVVEPGFELEAEVDKDTGGEL
jgi:hypothetical protein